MKSCLIFLTCCSIILFSCYKENPEILSLLKEIKSQNDVLKTQITTLQKTTDSLANVLKTTNSNILNLDKKVDSLKSQLTIVLQQINILNSQLTTANANISDIQAKIIELQKKCEELYKLLNDYINSLKVAKLDNLLWTQVSTGYCWRVIPNIDSTVLFLSRATDVLKSTNFGVNFISTGFSFPVIRESLGTVSGGAYSNFNGGQLVIAGMDKGYYMSNDNAVSFSSTGPTGFGCGSPSILALNDGRFIASMGGFQRGIYKSSGTDNQTWVNKYPGLDPNDFSQSSNIIFSATTGTIGGNGFILKSTNQGESWTNELSSSASSGLFCDVELLNDTLFFINSKGNFYASSISSINTNILRSNIPTSAYVDCVYSGTYKIFVAVSDNSGIYISNNRGLTWTRYTIPGVTVYNKVSVVKNKIFVTTTTGLYVSSL